MNMHLRPATVDYEAPIDFEPLPDRAHSRLAPLIVKWLSPEADLNAGAGRAIDLGMAGIFRLGLEALGIAQPGDELRRAERKEIAADLFARNQTGEILGALNACGITPLLFKGRCAAERLWPQQWMRPPGDLDILIEEEALHATLSALAKMGYRPLEGDAPGRWRPSLSGVDAAPSAPGMNVDVHVRLFRAIGSRLGTQDVLRRSVHATVAGAEVRQFEPADEVLYLMLHAANHGAIHLKWFADLHAAARVYPREVWERAAERAVACEATRAWWSVWRLLAKNIADMPGALPPKKRPPAPVRAMLKRLVRFDPDLRRAASTGLRSYALGWALEDRRKARIRRAMGLVERHVRRFADRLLPARAADAPAAVRNRRWVEKALESGHCGPMWLTLQGGSMSPSLRHGDRLLVAPLYKGEDLTPGDVIIVRNIHREAGYLAAHRVIGLEKGTVITRGDACRYNDPPVPWQNVLAKVIAVDRQSTSQIPCRGDS